MFSIQDRQKAGLLGALCEASCVLCYVPWLGGMKTVSRNRWSYKLVPACLGQAEWLQSLKD